MSLLMGRGAGLIEAGGLVGLTLRGGGPVEAGTLARLTLLGAGPVEAGGLVLPTRRGAGPVEAGTLARLTLLGGGPVEAGTLARLRPGSRRRGRGAPRDARPTAVESGRRCFRPARAALAARPASACTWATGERVQ